MTQPLGNLREVRFPKLNNYASVIEPHFDTPINTLGEVILVDSNEAWLRFAPSLDHAHVVPISKVIFGSL